MTQEQLERMLDLFYDDCLMAEAIYESLCRNGTTIEEDGYLNNGFWELRDILYYSDLLEADNYEEFISKGIQAIADDKIRGIASDLYKEEKARKYAKV